MWHKKHTNKNVFFFFSRNKIQFKYFLNFFNCAEVKLLLFETIFGRKFNISTCKKIAIKKCPIDCDFLKPLTPTSFWSGYLTSFTKSCSWAFRLTEKKFKTNKKYKNLIDLKEERHKPQHWNIVQQKLHHKHSKNQ